MIKDINFQKKRTKKLNRMGTFLAITVSLLLLYVGQPQLIPVVSTAVCTIVECEVTTSPDSVNHQSSEEPSNG